MIGTTLDQDNTLSLDRISQMRSAAHASIRHHAAEIALLASALENLDAAIRMAIVARSIDEDQCLVDSARRLAKLLDGLAVLN